MGGSSPPPPTPPKETSQAQTGANISTAIANNFMSNANLIGADGSTQTTNQTGTYRFTDPYTNQSYDIPTFTRTESLSPVRQQTLEQSNQANLNLATLGANTSQQLIGNMSKQLTADDLGARPTLGAMQQAGASPRMILAGQSPAMQRAGFISDMGRMGDAGPMGRMGDAASMGRMGDAGPMGRVGNASDLGRLGSSRQMSLSGGGNAMQRLGGDDTPQMRAVNDIANMDRLGFSASPEMRFANTGPRLGLMGEGAVPDLRTSYVDDFSADRSRVEDALFSRLNPQLQRDRSAMETQLSNQGIKLGSAAFDRAMNQFDQKSNDARMGAILAGGQEQSRLAGLARDQAMVGNNASGQQFSMRQSRQGFDNSALQQMGDNDFRSTGFNNAATQQMADNDVRRAGFNNAAGQSDLQNRLAVAGFNNSAAQQMADNRFRQVGFNNAAGQSEFQNNLAALGFNNAANQQMDESDFRRAGFNNEASQAEFQNRIAASGFNNTAAQSDYQNRLAAAGFNNTAAQSDIQNRLATAGFNNTAAQSDYQNRLSAAGFNNTAAQSDIQNRLAATGFDNTAAQSDFQNNLAASGFNNAAIQQMSDNNFRRTGFNNSLAMDQYNAGLSGRAQQMQEAFALDNQPVNKAMALASGTQVANPQFQPFNVNRIPTTDNAGIIQNYDQQNFQRWQAEEQQNQRMMGGLMGLGGAALGMFRFSDERLKENVEKVGKLDGHSLYRYNYKGDDNVELGVMAQEVEKKRPDAVKKTSGGVRMVDYGALFNAGKKGSR